jgi:hypothetical protein
MLAILLGRGGCLRLERGLALAGSQLALAAFGALASPSLPRARKRVSAWLERKGLAD